MLSMPPSQIPSNIPSTFPSDTPSNEPAKTNYGLNFILGLVFGIVGTTLVAAFMFKKYRKRSHKEDIQAGRMIWQEEKSPEVNSNDGNGSEEIKAKQCAVAQTAEHAAEIQAHESSEITRQSSCINPLMTPKNGPTVDEESNDMFHSEVTENIIYSAVIDSMTTTGLDRLDDYPIVETSVTSKMTQQSSMKDGSMTTQTKSTNEEQSNDMFPSEATIEKSIRSATVGSLITPSSDLPDVNLLNHSHEPTLPQYYKNTADTTLFLGANLMENREDSLSSESDDELLSPQKMTGENHDEFDKYKSQLLEKLRSEVEDTIADVDGMMSLAMTRMYMETEDTPLDLSWVGAEDLGSIEASCFCETYEWVRRNDKTATDTT